nr:uncharacterized protein LOC129384752 [Dermacentor andersoni]
MAGCNDCLDARAVTFGLEKLLRTGILCASQASNVGNGQIVMSMYSASTSTQLSRVDPAVPSGTSSGLDTSSIPQNTSAKTSSALLSICEPPSFVDDVNSLLAPLKVMPSAAFNSRNRCSSIRRRFRRESDRRTKDVQRLPETE